MNDDNKSLRDEKQQERRDLISRWLREKDISTQTDLVQEFGRLGIKCTQTTVSRDLAAMHVIKADGCYRLPPTTTGGLFSEWEREIVEHALTVGTAGENLVIVHTKPGAAQPVALALDRAKWHGVVGTLAGDDTIFIAVQSLSDRDAVTAQIQRPLARGASS